MTTKTNQQRRRHAGFAARRLHLRLCLDKLKPTERNRMERSGAERNGIKISFHCLDIL